ncbi:E3 ubiquitin-protein ligase UPL6-like [Rutidosis leptorrhynchoides]|uniref:E3 ubiquitin-protein ligase UPL6-like n=1 Tax=Rutidosis leptorrhynchoides TaxID=125765 RepID=UPI003A99A381
MAACTQSYETVLPVDISPEFPSYACLLGNTLEVMKDALAWDACPYDMVLPPNQSLYRESTQASTAWPSCLYEKLKWL